MELFVQIDLQPKDEAEGGVLWCSYWDLDPQGDSVRSTAWKACARLQVSFSNQLRHSLICTITCTCAVFPTPADSLILWHQLGISQVSSNTKSQSQCSSCRLGAPAGETALTSDTPAVWGVLHLYLVDYKFRASRDFLSSDNSLERLTGAR